MFPGAGKTTTFSMLTGDLSITEGTAYLDGFNIQTNLRQVGKRKSLDCISTSFVNFSSCNR